MPNAPNILFVMADQLAPQVLPAYGHTVVKTPHLDRLVERAAVFNNAYCNYPLCVPSRFSMLSGRLPSRVRAYDNASEFPASVPTFAHYLRAMGYRTCLSGKMHFVGPDQLHGYEERVTTDIYPADFLWTADWRLGEETWVPWYHSMRAIVDAGEWRRSLNVEFDDEVTFEATRWLHDYADDKQERPFLLTVSFISPHDPYLAPAQYWNRYGDDEIDLPGVPDIPLNERDAHSRRLYYATGRHIDPITEDDLRRARRAYYAMTSYVDDKLGQLISTLEETNLADNTIIVFTSDHGDSLGERGLYFKMSFFEWSARVPLIIATPGGKTRHIDENVSLVDLFPTLLDIAGDGQSPELVNDTDGHSLQHLLAGQKREWPNTVYAEYAGEGTTGPLFMVRQGRYKFIYGEPDAPLLYDLSVDPNELINLAGSDATREIQTQLQAAVHAQWDVEQLRVDIERDQRVRLFLQNTLNKGARTPWDYQPMRDASKQYFRLEGDIQDAYRVE